MSLLYVQSERAQTFLFWTSLDTDNMDLLISTASGPHLTFSHRLGNAVITGFGAKGGGVCRAV